MERMIKCKRMHSVIIKNRKENTVQTRRANSGGNPILYACMHGKAKRENQSGFVKIVTTASNSMMVVAAAAVA